MDFSRRLIPLRDRRRDWFFVLAFGCFAFSSFTSDALVALGVPMAADAPGFWARANYWYAAGTDPLLLANPLALRISTFIAAFVYGPFYLVLVYALVTGRDWIRMPAVVYVSVMTYGMLMFLGLEFLGDSPPTNFPRFAAFNFPYLVIPLMLGYRMRHPYPFSTEALPSGRLAGARAAVG